MARETRGRGMRSARKTARAERRNARSEPEGMMCDGTSNPAMGEENKRASAESGNVPERWPRRLELRSSHMASVCVGAGVAAGAGVCGRRAEIATERK